MRAVPAWWVIRFAGFLALLIAGLVADWGWELSAAAWLFVAFGLVAWSILDQDPRP